MISNATRMPPSHIGILIAESNYMVSTMMKGRKMRLHEISAGRKAPLDNNNDIL